MQFDNKVCIVTGGNAGIGRCIAESFSKEGARVYVIDRDIDHDTDENIFCFKGDISEKEILEDFAAWVLSKEEKVDFLINNACLMNGGILSGCSYEDFMYVQKVGRGCPLLADCIIQGTFLKRGIHRQHIFKQGIPVTSRYGKLYGSQGRHNSTYSCSRSKP